MKTIYIAASVYVGILSLLSSAVYLFRSTYMPYHQAALGVEWNALSPEHQVLHLGLMRVVGAGFLSVGTAIVVLLWRDLSRGDRWAGVLSGALGSIVFGVGLYANLLIAHVTGQAPPWPGTASGLFASILVGVLGAVRLLQRQAES